MAVRSIEKLQILSRLRPDHAFRGPLAVLVTPGDGQRSRLHADTIMEVWEHAFIKDYAPADKPKYIEVFISNINWEVVNHGSDGVAFVLTKIRGGVILSSAPSLKCVDKIGRRSFAREIRERLFSFRVFPCLAGKTFVANFRDMTLGYQPNKKSQEAFRMLKHTSPLSGSNA